MRKRLYFDPEVKEGIFRLMNDEVRLGSAVTGSWGLGGPVMGVLHSMHRIQ